MQRRHAPVVELLPDDANREANEKAREREACWPHDSRERGDEESRALEPSRHPRDATGVRPAEHLGHREMHEPRAVGKGSESRDREVPAAQPESESGKHRAAREDTSPTAENRFGVAGVPLDALDCHVLGTIAPRRPPRPKAWALTH